MSESAAAPLTGTLFGLGHFISQMINLEEARPVLRSFTLWRAEFIGPPSCAGGLDANLGEAGCYAPSEPVAHASAGSPV